MANCARQGKAEKQETKASDRRKTELRAANV